MTAPHPAPLTPPPVPAADRLALHATLLQLAGRIPDDGLAMMRTRLADGEPYTVVGMLAAAAGTGRVALTPGERHALTGLCAAYQVDPGPLDAAPPVDRVPPPLYLFEPDPIPFDHGLARYDEAALLAAPRVPGVRALWRSLRRRVAGGPATPDRQARSWRPVYLGECDPGTDVVEITAEIQYEIVAADDDIRPRVEIFEAGTALPPYHEAALAASMLLWTRQPLSPVRLARVFDGNHAQHGPYFTEDHAILDGGERDRVLAYLRAGEQVLATRAVMVDVVARERVARVPVGFRSDGVWVWNDAVTYYLEHDRLAPEPELVAHILSRDELPEPLDRLAYHLAIASLAGPVAAAAEATTAPWEQAWPAS